MGIENLCSLVYVYMIHDLSINRIYNIVLTTNVHKYTKIGFIHTVKSYMFRSNAKKKYKK
jgi:hypothetical protein